MLRLRATPIGGVTAGVRARLGSYLQELYAESCLARGKKEQLTKFELGVSYGGLSLYF